MRNVVLFLLLTCCTITTAQAQTSKTKLGDKIAVSSELSHEQLKDKIKGGWAGQTIGVTFGWPSEFQYQGTYIQDYEVITWNEDYVNRAMDTFPGLYDDVYVDLTFVEVFDKEGMDATQAAFGKAFAASKYQLWHANQASRYNLQQGIPASEAGHWLNNPHADDIDFQIESDFAGLMSPGMPNSASEICERVGRLMNSGDGWYGGVYVSNMYSVAFISESVREVVTEALKAIPQESKFYQCIADVIQWHKLYPNDWKRTWFEIQRKWAEDKGCPSMVFHPLNIDAKLNSAYVVLGLLYGEGDFTKTLQIATRAGQDSDCNPSTAAGILGVMKGYSNIPAYWLSPVKKAEERNFSFSEYSLARAYEASYRHALENIKKNGGRVKDNSVHIRYLPPKPVAFEENFAGHFPKARIPLPKKVSDSCQFSFDGIGFVLRGYVHKKNPTAPLHTLEAALIIDGKEVERTKLPVDYLEARTDLFWRYQLQKSHHKAEILILNPHPDYEIVTTDILVYDGSPVAGYKMGEISD